MEQSSTSTQTTHEAKSYLLFLILHSTSDCHVMCVRLSRRDVIDSQKVPLPVYPCHNNTISEQTVVNRIAYDCVWRIWLRRNFCFHFPIQLENASLITSQKQRLFSVDFCFDAILLLLRITAFRTVNTTRTIVIGCLLFIFDAGSSKLPEYCCFSHPTYRTIITLLCALSMWSDLIFLQNLVPFEMCHQTTFSNYY